jgi:ribulose-phosphate 3-epimerase
MGPNVVAAIRPHTGKPLDVHLMIAPADPYIEAFARAGADHIIVHVEAGPHLHRSLQAIRALGKKAGVSLNPATPVEAIAAALDYADLVLVMSVSPGFGGQSFLPASLARIAALKRMIAGRDILIEVDGGIGPGNAASIVAAGADALVAGSSIFGAGGDYAAAVAALRGDRK